MLTTTRITEILKNYEDNRSSIYKRSDNPTIPIVMNYMVFKVLRNTALTLLPEYRKVMLCFEHFKTSSILSGLGTPKSESKRDQNEGSDDELPNCIVLQVRFIGGYKINKFQNLGTITYLDFSDRSLVASMIKDYIEDLYRCDLHVVASCSSGKCEIMAILCEMRVTYENDYIVYPVRNRSKVIHIFDSSWLMRKLYGEFFKKDVNFIHNNRMYQASSEHLLSMFTNEALNAQEWFKASTCRTTAAAKLFSSKTLLAFTHQCDKTALLESQGTQLLVLFFDQLFDTFNSTIFECNPLKLLRKSLAIESGHWDIWNCLIIALKTMRFVKKSMPPLTMNRAASESSPSSSTVPKKKKARKKKGASPKKPCNLKAKGTNIEQLFYLDDEYSLDKMKIIDHKPKLVKLITQELCNGPDGPYTPVERAILEAKVRKSVGGHSTGGSCDSVMISLEKWISSITYSQYPAYLEEVKRLMYTLKTKHDALFYEYGPSMLYEYLTFKYCSAMTLTIKKSADTEEFYRSLRSIMNRTLHVEKLFEINFFQMWVASVTGLKKIFLHLRQFQQEHFDTLLMNCDAIHSFVAMVREHNGLPPVSLVKDHTYACILDFETSILAFSKDFNTSIDDLVISTADICRMRRDLSFDTT